MVSRPLALLLASARRAGARHDAEDIVQEALMAAFAAGRFDLEDNKTLFWLRGVVRNRARMHVRTATRRRARENAWAGVAVPPQTDCETAPPADILKDLPPALHTLAALVLTGHNRREIAYLLRLPDTALRQRVVSLRRLLAARGLAAPEEMVGLNLDLAYGRMRIALRQALSRHGGIFASHDPDGHIFLVRRSQNQPARQLDAANPMEKKT